MASRRSKHLLPGFGLTLGVSMLYVTIIIAGRMIESLSHVNARVSFGWLGERLLVSPRFHRAHHAIGVGHEGQYQGCNFAVLFPLWDVLFRTYRRPDGWPPCGLDEGAPQSLGEGFAYLEAALVSVKRP